MDIVTDYIRHTWPLLPGGAITVALMVVILIGLLMLYRGTGWGGWMAWFVAIGMYCVPVLVEFHR